MNDLQIFKNKEFGEIRCLEINGEPHFVGKDAAIILGYKNPQKAIKEHVDEEDKKMGEQNGTPYIIDNLGRKQYPIFINESGLYSLILSSNLPNAKKFKRWVTSEVLPTLRKEGTYSIKKRHKPIDRAIRQHFNIAETIIHATGIKQELAYAVAISEAEKETGYSYDEYKKLLPSAKHNVASFNPTQIGIKLGGVKPNTVNKILEGLGLQINKNGKWRITEEGKKFGEEMPFTRNEHSNYRIVWHEKIIEVIENNKK